MNHVRIFRPSQVMYCDTCHKSEVYDILTLSRLTTGLELRPMYEDLDNPGEVICQECLDELLCDQPIFVPNWRNQ